MKVHDSSSNSLSLTEILKTRASRLVISIMPHPVRIIFFWSRRESTQSPDNRQTARRVYGVMQSVCDQNLQKIVNQVPMGFLVDARWLARKGLAPSAVRSYVKAGWLEELLTCVYRRPLPSGAQTVHWETLVLSLYQIMGVPVHIGGDTALAHDGIEYSVPLNGRGLVWLYAADFPNWIRQLPSNTRYRLRPNDLLRTRVLD